jgi:hypothetical protein
MSLRQSTLKATREIERLRTHLLEQEGKFNNCYPKTLIVDMKKKKTKPTK